jgi:multiple sugar transport system substrate-binding protein
MLGGLINQQTSSTESVGESSIEDSKEDSSSDSSGEHTHTWTETVVLEATCTERGLKLKKCDCGEEEYEELPAAHDLVTYQEQYATCSRVGIKRISCTKCDYVTYEEEATVAHTFLFNGKCFWCGKTEQELNSAPAPVVAYDGSNVTITFYHTMGYARQETLNDIIKEFNALYPNITIEHENRGSYDMIRDDIVLELMNGKSPNLAYCYSDHVALYDKAQAVATLDEYIAYTETVTRADGTTEIMGLTQADIDGFVDAYYEEGRVFGDGKMYTLPHSKSTEVLYYNKTFFEEHNLQVPTTWDEVEAVAEYIKSVDPTAIPLGYDSSANWFITMCEQLGSPYTSLEEGNHFLYDNPANHEFVSRFREWYQNGYVTTAEIYGEYMSNLFTKSKVYMSIGSSAGASYHCPSEIQNVNGQIVYPFEVGVAMIPQVDINNPKVVLQGPSLCMFKKSNPQEMAATWLFMKYLTTDLTAQAYFSAASGFAPVIEDLDKKHPVFEAMLEKADGNAYLPLTCIKQCLAQSDALFVSPAFAGSVAAREMVGELLPYCMIGAPAEGQSAADFIKTAFKESIQWLQAQY